GGGNTGNQRGLAGVGKAYQAHVGKQLELETQPLFLTGSARFVFGGSLVGSGGESGIAAPSSAAACRHEALAGLGEIEQAFAGRVIVDDCADRNFDHRLAAIGARPIAAFSVTAALALVFWIETQVEERVLMPVRDENDVAAPAAIAAAGTAARDVFLAPERQTAIA